MLPTLSAEGWTRVTAGHLLNRAGFGGPPAAVDALHRLGLKGAVDRLLDFRPAWTGSGEPGWTAPDPERAAHVREFTRADAEKKKEMQRVDRRLQAERMVELRGWWLGRMAGSPHPLQEKLTLFWHGHFATSVVKVRDARLMWLQNSLFRSHAAGNWKSLLIAVTQDPAMLIWLDQAQSRQQHPNENYARELMELFALGEGHYSEADVREAARALTGVSYDRVRQESVYRPRIHDDGAKVFLGRQGRLGWRDVIDAILAQPEAGRFLARKLWTFFASDEAPPDVVEAMAQTLRDSGWELEPVLRLMFTSAAFHAPGVLRCQVKSPVQFLVGATLQLETGLPADGVASNALRMLGQELFAPPNVKGWDGGVNWLPTHHLLNRHRLAAWLVLGEEGFGAGGPRGAATMRAGRGRTSGLHPEFDASRLVPAAERVSPEAVLSCLERRLLQAPLRPRTAAAVREALPRAGVPSDVDVARAVYLVLCTPEYELT